MISWTVFEFDLYGTSKCIPSFVFCVACVRVLVTAISYGSPEVVPPKPAG